MIISDGTANFVVMNLNSRGMDCTTYSCLDELVKDQTRLCVFNWTKPFRSDGMSDAQWIDLLKEAKKVVLEGIVKEIDEAITAEN